MPLAHVAVIVSDLHQSSYLYLSALRPLGYCVVEQRCNELGIGVHEPEFWLIGRSPGFNPTTTHIAISSPSRTGVRSFYGAALTCGATPYAAPAYRNQDADFNAAILDRDGNTLEVVHVLPPPTSGSAMPSTAVTVVNGESGSRVLNWRNSVADSLGDRDGGTIVAGSVACRSVANRSVAGSVTGKSVTGGTIVARSVAGDSAAGGSVAGGSVVSQRTYRSPPSVASVATTKKSSPASGAGTAVTASAPAPKAAEEPSATRSLTGDVLDLVTTALSASSITPKAIAGTLIGAAAGAAVAYAMVKAEEDSAEKEAAFEAKMAAKEQLREKAERVLNRAATMANPAPPAPPSERREGSVAGSFAGSRAESGFVMGEVDPEAHWGGPIRMIEAPPSHVDGLEQYFIRNPAGWDERSLAPSRVTLSRANSLPVDRTDYPYAVAALTAPPSVVHRAAHVSTVAPSYRSYREDSVYSSSANMQEIAPASRAGSRAPSAAPSHMSSRRSSAPSEHSGGPAPSIAASRASTKHSPAVSVAMSRASTAKPTASPAPSVAASTKRSPAPSVASTRRASEDPAAPASKAASLAPSLRSLEPNPEVEEPASDNDTIAPCDSISMVGSSHSRRSQRSAGAGARSVVSVHSSHSKASRHSKHSKASGRSSQSKRAKSAMGGEGGEKDDDARSVRSTSTVKPVRRCASAADLPGREGSVAGSRKGSVVTLPEGRGKGEKKKKKVKRSVVSFVDGARLW